MMRKRGGPSQPLRHRVTNYDDDRRDGHPLVSDWFEAVLVFTALCAVFGGVLAFYYVSQ